MFWPNLTHNTFYKQQADVEVTHTVSEEIDKPIALENSCSHKNRKQNYTTFYRMKGAIRILANS